jgi:hypothetical protein
VENAKVYKELRRGRIDPSLASRLSQIPINQRVILESFDAEKRIAQLEALLEQASRRRPGSSPDRLPSTILLRS